MKELSATLLKQLWPPIMAPKTRKWVNDNIREGRIREGEFTVNLPVDALAAAQRQRRLPRGLDQSLLQDGRRHLGLFQGPAAAHRRLGRGEPQGQ